MGARALASATISFGLVSIPVKLFTTQESGTQLSFNMLHSCGSRIQQQTYCPRCEKTVARDELLKGYAFAKDQYVTFAPEELKALEEEGSRSIEIVEFIPLETVDPLYFEKAYYLGPDRGGDKPYKLLSLAMQRTGRAALARYAARGKQYLVLVRPFENGLLMQQLRYADEIRSFEEVERIDATLQDAELELAEQLIGQIAADQFDPAPYHDVVKERIEAAIQRKIDGEESIAAGPADAPETRVIDLMDALRASLDEAGSASPADAEGRKRRGPKRAAGSGSRGKAKRAAKSDKASP